MRFAVTQYPAPLTIDAKTRETLKVLFLAKHALGDGSLHPEDGNHAVYHNEVRTILEGLFDNLVVGNQYAMLFDPPEVDFVFSLLNRGGFVNSEMLVPLLCNRKGLPYLGGSPILRGLSDDKHLSKLVARARGIPTADWAIYRKGGPVDEKLCPMAERMVIKPNASSASWGVRDAGDWAGVKDAVAAIHEEGHDAIVEPFLTGSDVEVPVVTIHGRPLILPMMLFEQADRRTCAPIGKSATWSSARASTSWSISKVRRSRPRSPRTPPIWRRNSCPSIMAATNSGSIRTRASSISWRSISTATCGARRSSAAPPSAPDGRRNS